MRSLLAIFFFLVSCIGALALLGPAPTSAFAAVATATATATTSAAPVPGTASIAIGTQIIRQNSNGSTPPNRPTYTIPGASTTGTDIYINYDDCINNRQFLFSVTPYSVGVSPFPNGTPAIQAWSGLNCQNGGAGQGGSALQTYANGGPTCWPVNTSPQLNTSSNSQSITVKVRDIIGFYFQTIGTADAGVAPTANFVYPVPTSAADQGLSVCSSQGAIQGPITINLFFFWMNSGLVVVNGSQTPVSIPFSLVGPPAPTNVQSGLPGRQIYLNYTAGNGPTYQYVNAYCVPKPGTEEAGLPILDSGTPTPVITPSDAGGDASASCAILSAYIPAGTVPNSAFSCGSDTVTISASTPSSTYSTTVKNVQVGTQYAVALAGVDLLNNVGPLSNSVCVTPIPTSDFWDLYKAAGGKAEGCAVASPGAKDLSPARPLTIAAGSAMVIASMLVRRRRRQ